MCEEAETEPQIIGGLQPMAHRSQIMDILEQLVTALQMEGLQANKIKATNRGDLHGLCSCLRISAL
jgi:hypothetical protein